ncbi:Chromosome transmission fidelity protein 8 [Rhizopus azygosporus]|uniref:Chromosome transmission fidelity protein 8 n=1 Tax=Rhizopus azygosporus TaxID=86630 RepID=A0A367KAA7_RHIAZ|nr:Chromosome transmission fidelity protein 8 [Rhizopus azygosporus]
MVNIVIHPYNQSSQKQDLLVLDFQGSFDSGEVVDLSLVKFGNVTLNENSAELVIGHHRLVGKKVKLPKPYAVIHKRKDSMEASYDVVSFIKEKYVFSQRPGLIVQENLRNLTRIGG